MSSQRPLAIATVACTAFVVLAMLKGFWFLQEDDAYIFYSYAQNLADGHGYVFNPGERVNATTSPLYTLLLALLYSALRFLPFVTLPLLGHLIGGISLFLIGFVLMRTFEGDENSLYSYALPLIFLASPFVPRAVGMELFLTMMLGVLSLYFYAKEKRVAAALSCSMAVLARPDMLLLAGVLVLYDLARYRRLPTWRMTIVFLLPIAAWAVFSQLYFGNVIPSTFSAKLVQTTAGLWGEDPVFFRGLLAGYAWYGGTINTKLLAVLLSLSAITILWKLREWSVFRHPVLHVILIWNTIYFLVYGLVLDAPAYAWYYTPLALSIAVLLTLPIEAVYRMLIEYRLIPRAVVLSLAYTALVLAGLVFPAVGLKQPTMPTYVNYKRAAQWLNENAPAGSSVGANDIGTIRFFYVKGTIIDGAGLVTPAVVEHLRRRDFWWYFHRYKPDYLMFQHPPNPDLENMAYEEWFQKEYAMRRIFRSHGHACAIYEKRKS